MRPRAAAKDLGVCNHSLLSSRSMVRIHQGGVVSQGQSFQTKSFAGQRTIPRQLREALGLAAGAQPL
jgi:hypothetical protein